MGMDSDKQNFEMDRRLRHLERELASFSTLLARNSEILDDIRSALNRPVNWPAWIGTSLTIMTLFGALLYGAYVRPLESKIDEVAAHSKETRTKLDTLIQKKVDNNVDNGTN